MARHPDVGAARAQVASLGRRLVAEGLTTGTGGNLSARAGDLIAASPSGVPYGEVEPADVPVLTPDGEQVAGADGPTSEWAMHAAVYRAREEVGGVVHAHSPHATTFAVLREPVPATHYLVGYAGESVPVAEYATHGTEAIGEAAVAALGDDHDACLLANHGVLAVGDSLPDAFEVALAVEFCARVHYQAEAVGEPVELPDEEVAEIRRRLDEYRGR